MSHIRKLGEPRVEEEPVQETPKIYQMGVTVPVTSDTSEQTVDTQMINEVKEITKTVDTLKDNEELLKELGITLPDLSITNSMSTANTMADLMLDAIALKAKFGKKAKGDPSDVYNMLPNRLKDIDIIVAAKEIEAKTSKLTASERKLIIKLAKIYRLREETWNQPIEKTVEKLKKELPVEPIKEIDDKVNAVTDSYTHIEEEPPGKLLVDEDKVTKIITMTSLKNRVLACASVAELNKEVTAIESEYDNVEGGDTHKAAEIINKHKAYLESALNSPIDASVFENVKIDVPEQPSSTIKQEVGIEDIDEPIINEKEEPVEVTPVEEKEVVIESKEEVKEEVLVEEEPTQKTSKTEVVEDSIEQTILDVIDEDNPMCATPFGRLAYVYLNCTENTHVVTPEDIDEIADKVYACDCVTEKVADQLVNEAINQIVEDNAKLAAKVVADLPEVELPEEVAPISVSEPKPLEQAPSPTEVEPVTPEPEVKEEKSKDEEPTPVEQVVEPTNDKVREYDLLIELFGELNNTETNMLNYDDVGMLLSTINIDTLTTLEHKLVYKEAKAKYEA